MTEHEFIETTIAIPPKQAEAGRKAADICQEYGIFTATLYQWRRKHRVIEFLDIKR